MTRGIVAVDCSKVSMDLIPFAFNYALTEKLSELTFLHVVQKPAAGSEWWSLKPDTEEELEERACTHFEQVIAKVYDELKISPVKYSVNIVSGTPYERIVEFAETEGADVILIGHRGMSNVKRFVIGSVAAKVVRHAPCSVHVFRPRNSS